MNSHAWRFQTLPDPLPHPLNESEYCVPMQRNFSSNDNRKNYTDMQETAQWVSGVEIPCAILEALGIGGASVAPRSLEINNQNQKNIVSDSIKIKTM